MEKEEICLLRSAGVVRHEAEAKDYLHKLKGSGVLEITSPPTWVFVREGEAKRKGEGGWYKDILTIALIYQQPYPYNSYTCSKSCLSPVAHVLNPSLTCA